MIYSIVSEKGGVGKTSVCEAISDGLQLRGQRVLVLDADPQTCLTASMSADRTKPTLYDFLKDAADAIQTTRRGDLIAGDRRLARITKIDPAALRDALRPIRGEYDTILIDCPPAHGPLSSMAIIAADELIIPVTADAYSLQAIGNIRTTIQEAERGGHTVKIAGLLITRYVGRTIVNKELSRMIEDAAAELNTRAFDTKIRECAAIRTAQAMRQGIFEFAPRSNAAKDYAAFIDELTK